MKFDAQAALAAALDPEGGINAWRRPIDPHKGLYYLMPPQPPPRFWLDPALSGRPAEEGARLTEIVEKIDRDDTLTEGEFFEYMKLRGFADLFFYAKNLCGHDWLAADLHGPLAWAWQAPDGWTTEWGQMYDRYRLGVIARGHLKTTLLTVDAASWDAIRDVEERLLIYTHGLDFTAEVMGPIKDLYEGQGKGAALYQKCYGHLIPEPGERGKKYKWDQLHLTLKRQGRYTDPTIKGGAVGAKITGTHSTKQYIDDLVGEELTRTRMGKVLNAIENLQFCYASMGLSRRRMVGTPWAFSDPITYAMKTWPNALVARLPWRRPNGDLLFDKSDVPEALRINKANPWFFSCNTGETPILMADWSMKRLDHVEPGESVMGWETASSGRQQLVPSKVLFARSRVASVQTITMESGAVVRCTPDHQWWTGKNGSYSPALPEAPLVRICSLVEPLPEHLTRTAAWLGGLFDGEGTVHPGGPISISQSQKANPVVCKAIETALDALGFTWTFRQTVNGCGDYRLGGGRQTALKFLEWCKPVRGYKITDAITRKDIARTRDVVKTIEDGGTDRVYSMQTDTGNYVAWGLASKNCQYDVVPKSENNNGFQKKWFRYFTREDKSIVVRDESDKVIRRVQLADCNIFIFIDPNTGREPGEKVTADANAPKSRKHDFAGWIVLAVDRERNWYVLSAIRRRCNPSELMDLTFQLTAIWQPVKVCIEQRAAQILFVELFVRAFKDGRPPFVIDDFEGGHTSKEERIKGLIPMYANGKVYHREFPPNKIDPQIAEGTASLEQELEDFPSAEFDDLGDALSAALKKAYAPGTNAPTVKSATADVRFEEKIAHLDRASRRIARAWKFKAKEKPDEYWFDA